jgi:hypothetical protein
MRKTLCSSSLIIFCVSLPAQTPSTHEKAAKTIFEGQTATLRLAPHLTTTIRLPDPVNSVVVGDSSLFQAEYSPDEPLLVFAKPLTATAAESNLVISTTHGRHFVLSLKSPESLPAGAASGVDLFVNCRSAGIFFIEETFPSALIPETLDLGSAAIRDSAIGSAVSDSAADRFELEIWCTGKPNSPRVTSTVTAFGSQHRSGSGAWCAPDRVFHRRQFRFRKSRNGSAASATGWSDEVRDVRTHALE